MAAQEALPIWPPSAFAMFHRNHLHCKFYLSIAILCLSLSFFLSTHSLAV